MLNILSRCTSSRPADATLTLCFEERQRSRLRTLLDNGAEAGLFLDRGQVLRDGDRLTTAGGVIIEVRAAPEPVSTVACADAVQLARAAYHLGNRHVALQVGDGWVRYRNDHVLDAMVRGLGLEVVREVAPFEPEGGAYGGHAHRHGHE
jgi:urease accessory protein